jgi:hypothetical protein
MQLGTMPSLELQGRQMRRREFITFLGGSMVAWPCAIRAQQVERVRRIGVRSALAADDPQGNAMIAAFKQGLQQLGWADGRNLQTEYRWGAGKCRRYTQIRDRTGKPCAGCLGSHGWLERRAVTPGDQDSPDRIRKCSRPGRLRFCRKSLPAGQQCDRFCAVRIQFER